MDDNLVNIEGLKQLWKLRVELAAQLCVWRALLNKLPIRENLTKRRVVLSCILCPFCKKHMEAAQHLFLTCEITRKVWDKLC